ncbi:hypothetical protein PIB30_086405 [Stylosanthes scabra]|uniref:Uncharacterized protein n=1 Tax=Stylosanthes scabra TaxID=79078 RepID=A0ABU6UVU2_9FABA|nr:hypothetical protein [Stylosanthes scabra]
MANESMLFPYQNTTRQMREMEQQGIPITMANLNIHWNREEEMRQERMRYEKVLEEATTQKAKEQNKDKARGIEEDYDDEETEDDGGEWWEKDQKEAWKARKEENRATGQKQSYSNKNRVLTPRRHYPCLGVAELASPFGLIQHPMPRRVARHLGVDGAARKLALHQGLNA